MKTIIRLEELCKEIDQLRKIMIEIGTYKGLNHPDTVKASTELDKKLNIYRKLLRN